MAPPDPEQQRFDREFAIIHACEAWRTLKPQLHTVHRALIAAGVIPKTDDDSS